jgi:pimeloyl-ACP methyl ester carboxylesterase
MINAGAHAPAYALTGWPVAAGEHSCVREMLAMIKRRVVLAAGLAGIGVAGAFVAVGYRGALQAARRRVADYRSKIVTTRFGDLEYAEAGSGPAVLMIHGSGGGCDQGLLFADPLVRAGYRVIAPSRFGYLRSAFPADPSPENQADAFVALLDHVGIDRIVAIGGSAGALSATAFAIGHPDRCAALVLVVPAAYAPNRPPARPWSPTETAIVETALGSDLIFWSALSVMPDTMIKTILATDPALLDTASPAERRRVQAVLDAILPVSDRAKGLLNDMRQAGDPPQMAIETITAPTLAISLDDDRYLTADAARYVADTVPGARLILYRTGGHVWIGHNEDMFAAIGSFIRETGYK